MAADPQVSFLEGALAALSKLWPPVVGALISIRFQPKESTKLDRAFSAGSGIGLSMFASPAIVDWVGISSFAVAQGIAGGIALFGLIVIAEVVAGLKAMEIGAIMRDFLRSILRINK